MPGGAPDPARTSGGRRRQPARASGIRRPRFAGGPPATGRMAQYRTRFGRPERVRYDVDGSSTPREHRRPVSSSTSRRAHASCSSSRRSLPFGKRPVLAMRAVDDQHLAAAAGALAVHDAAGRSDGLHGSFVRPTPGAALFIVRHCHASRAGRSRIRSDVAHSSSERNRIETGPVAGDSVSQPGHSRRSGAPRRRHSRPLLSNVVQAVGRGSDRRRVSGSVRSVRRVGSDVPRRCLRDRRDGCSRAERKLHAPAITRRGIMVVFTMASAQVPAATGPAARVGSPRLSAISHGVAGRRPEGAAAPFRAHRSRRQAARGDGQRHRARWAGSFDDLLRPGQNRWREGEAESPRS